MSESIAEMVIPGTYIEVRSEGLISVGSIATGNIGIVGTAARGPVGDVQRSGAPSRRSTSTAPTTCLDAARRRTALTLVRALEQVFAAAAATCSRSASPPARRSPRR